MPCIVKGCCFYVNRSHSFISSYSVINGLRPLKNTPFCPISDELKIGTETCFNCRKDVLVLQPFYGIIICEECALNEVDLINFLEIVFNPS
jgi:hypothetical protein